MTHPPSTDNALAWCRERLLVPGHPLTLTLPYAEPSLRDALLALHGLIGEIAAVPESVSDAGVARRKLGWWQAALTERQPHPAIQAWLACDGPERLTTADFEPLIEAVAVEIEPPRFERHQQLIEHAERVAGAAARLEACLIDAGDAGTATLIELAGAAYRVRMVRDLVLDARRGRWAVPLDLQAEYQLTRSEVVAGEYPRRLDALVRHLVGDALITLNRDLASLEPFWAWRQRHLVLRLKLDALLAGRILRRPLRVTTERIGSGGPVAAFALWRLARRMQRRVR
ncbi:MAG: squalene/phytoene synthase family protein [Wenzhouxiangellaceae bacterium]|nr:squalene/phytoene synthase family protein [Wenzhouxiangellaceae bacterium]